MIIRWMGAFRSRNVGIEEALRFELTSAQNAEVAAEVIQPGDSTDMPKHVDIGLQVEHSATVRRFNSDVFSEKGENGKLRCTRGQNSFTHHREAFCNPVYKRIVLKGHPSRIAKKDIEAVKKISLEFAIPVAFMSNGKLQEVRF